MIAVMTIVLFAVIIEAAAGSCCCRDVVVMLLMIIDAVWLGRTVSNKVDIKFPENTESRWKLGFYAALRNSQMRRMRVPRPAVSRGAQID